MISHMSKNELAAIISTKKRFDGESEQAIINHSFRLVIASVMSNMNSAKMSNPIISNFVCFRYFCISSTNNGKIAFLH